jgi:hypothetical protein
MSDDWRDDEYTCENRINSINSSNKRHENQEREQEEEEELRNAGYKTVKEWNSVDRSVKKGEKGKYLPYEKIRLFSQSQTIESKFSGQPEANLTNKRHFQTFEEAMTWAKSNPGKVITRSPTGKGYIG